jgi:hypothetical protein
MNQFSPGPDNPIGQVVSKIRGDICNFVNDTGDNFSPVPTTPAMKQLQQYQIFTFQSKR